MNPSKWVDFSQLSPRSRERIEAVYPYLKVNQCQFQDKESGLFMKHGNSVKIEKLLDPQQSSKPVAAKNGQGGSILRKRQS